MRAQCGQNHLVSVDDLDDRSIESIFLSATQFLAEPRGSDLKGRIVTPLFFQPSTRTRLGFEAAALRLGGSVAGFADGNTSRCQDATKETFEDSIRTISSIADFIVIRSGEPQAGRRAAQIASCSVINAGDSDEHPTQALVDCFTMRTLLEKPMREAHIGLVGCLSNRCTAPLIRLLARQRISRATILQADDAPLPTAAVSAFDAAGVRVDTATEIEELLAECDVVSVSPTDTTFVRDHTAISSEGARKGPLGHVITAEHIRRTGSRALIMHPLPRRNEIATDVDYLPQAAYFRQVALSVPLRMGVFVHVIGAGRRAREVA